MNKDYSKWYWKVYRWFRWEAKYFPLRFKTGVEKLMEMVSCYLEG
jgi:hypothetical protein